MKKVGLLFIFSFLLITFNSFAQSEWRLVDETTLKGNIRGSVSQGYIFKVSSREYYIINEKVNERVQLRNPEVKIFQNASEFKLFVDGFQRPILCRKVSNVIESQIEGDFNGWDGETIYKLSNGQTWQQSSFAFLRQNLTSPNVYIYTYNGKYKMTVEGIGETIDVKVLK